jgi:hypothetical protein
MTFYMDFHMDFIAFSERFQITTSTIETDPITTHHMTAVKNQLVSIYIDRLLGCCLILDF